MTVFETLHVIAQIAATFAGFTALVSIVDQGQGGQWARISVWRILVMLRTCLILMFMCFVPILLANFDIEMDNVWQSSLVIALLNSIYSMTSTMKSVIALGVEGRARLNKSVRNINVLFSVGLILIPILSLTKLIPMSLSGAYVLYLILSLVIAAAVFYALVAQMDISRIENKTDNKSED